MYIVVVAVARKTLKWWIKVMCICLVGGRCMVQFTYVPLILCSHFPTLNKILNINSSCKNVAIINTKTSSRGIFDWIKIEWEFCLRRLRFGVQTWKVPYINQKHAQLPLGCAYVICTWWSWISWLAAVHPSCQAPTGKLPSIGTCGAPWVALWTGAHQQVLSAYFPWVCWMKNHSCLEGTFWRKILRSELQFFSLGNLALAQNKRYISEPHHSGWLPVDMQKSSCLPRGPFFPNNKYSILFRRRWAVQTCLMILCK